MKQPAMLALARFEVGQTSRSARVLQDPLFAQRNQPYPSHEQTDVEHRPRWSESRGSAPPIAPHRSESPGRAQLLRGYRSESPRPSFISIDNATDLACNKKPSYLGVNYSLYAPTTKPLATNHGERSSPHSAPRRAEPSLPAARFVEFSLFPLDRFRSEEHTSELQSL